MNNDINNNQNNENNNIVPEIKDETIPTTQDNFQTNINSEPQIQEETKPVEVPVQEDIKPITPQIQEEIKPVESIDSQVNSMPPQQEITPSYEAKHNNEQIINNSETQIPQPQVNTNEPNLDNQNQINQPDPKNNDKNLILIIIVLVAVIVIVGGFIGLKLLGNNTNNNKEKEVAEKKDKTEKNKNDQQTQEINTEIDTNEKTVPVGNIDFTIPNYLAHEVNDGVLYVADSKTNPTYLLEITTGDDTYSTYITYIEEIKQDFVNEGIIVGASKEVTDGIRNYFLMEIEYNNRSGVLVITQGPDDQAIILTITAVSEEGYKNGIATFKTLLDTAKRSSTSSFAPGKSEQIKIELKDGSSIQIKDSIKPDIEITE